VQRCPERPQQNRRDCGVEVFERTLRVSIRFAVRVRSDKRADIHEAVSLTRLCVDCWQSLRKNWMTA